MREGPNRDYYLKERARDHTHTQALIALAGRRIDVLWPCSVTIGPSPSARPHLLPRLDNIIGFPMAGHGSVIGLGPAFEDV